MKNTMKILFTLVLAAAFSFGQASLSSTTLGAAITSTTQTTITLASTSTMLASGSNNAVNTVLYVDKEFMWVRDVVDSTHVTVTRGKGIGASTRVQLHQSGAKVYFAITTTSSPAAGYFSNGSVESEVNGQCTANQYLVLPRVYLFSGNVWDCKRTGAAGTAGQWILVGNGSMAPMGQTAAAFCTGNLGSAETEYLNGAACSGATTATFAYVVTTPGTLANLYSSAGTNVSGGTNKDVVTVYKNGSSTALTCTYATGGAAVTCSDTTHSVPVVPGDLLTFQLVTATSDTGANVRASVGIY